MGLRDFLLLSQGFESFPSDLQQARWRNLVRVVCLQTIEPMVACLFFCWG